MNIKISLDSQRFSKKPSKNEIPVISNRLAEEVIEVSIEEFAIQTVQPNGKTFSGAIFSSSRRSNKTWKNQQVFALDIDKGITVKGVLDKCNELNIMPAFIYTTFSSSDDKQKFRVVFVLDEVIEDIRIRNYIQKALMKIFPQVDLQTKDPARMLFGGKEIVYSNYSSVISFYDINIAVIAVIKGGSNPKRDMDKFCKSVGVDMLNGNPRIEILELTEKESNNVISLTKKRSNPIDNNRVGSKNCHSNYKIYFSSSNSIEYNRSFDENDNEVYFDNIISTKKCKELIKNYPFEDLYSNCKLYRESINGDYWLYHNEMFGIMTNLLKIKGGTNKVKEILSSREVYQEKMRIWDQMRKQIYKADYAPTRCVNFCPFSGECIHSKNMIDQGKSFRGKIQILGVNKLKPLKDAEKEFNEVFNYVMKETNEGIYIIKAPTGIGKTSLYLNSTKEKNMTIAVPTHELKEQISKDLNKLGVNHYLVPQLPELETDKRLKLERLYNIGSYSGANMFLKELTSTNKEIKEYLNSIDTIRKIKNQTIITTHQRALFQKDSNDTLLIDEDIILNGLLNIDQVSMKDITYSLMNIKSNPNSEMKNTQKIIDKLYNDLLDTQDGVIYQSPNYYGLYDHFLEKVIIKDTNITTNIIGFFKSSYYMRIKNKSGRDNIVYIQKRNLPANKKIIILSATINEKIAKKLFGNNIFFHDIGEVEQVGKIYQIPNKSFSKYTIYENYDKMNKLAKRIIDEFNPESKVITFKGIFKDIGESNINFWNNAGRNDLTGKNITVIGTPHVQPYTYMLISKVLGYEVKMNDNVIKYQPVSRGNYKFYFNTFKNDDLLREIQFYFIETELLQTIGRARTLRKNVKVLVLSNFPVKGAEFIEIPLRDYIRDIDAS